LSSWHNFGETKLIKDFGRRVEIFDASTSSFTETQKTFKRVKIVRENDLTIPIKNLLNEC
jgi:hypothetical protein